MKWAHLPEPGGLYDQHPDLIAKFEYIFAKRAEYQEAERKREEAKQKRGGKGGGPRIAGRR